MAGTGRSYRQTARYSLCISASGTTSTSGSQVVVLDIVRRIHTLLHSRLAETINNTTIIIVFVLGSALDRNIMALKFCANISFMFTESGWLERYHLAKVNGFRAVESAFPSGFALDEVVAAKTAANVDQVLINTCNGEW